MKTITSNHPLTRAKWLWPHGNVYLENCFAQFRYDFELQQVPDRAPLFITADQSYRLFVNGRYVCRGPARGYQSHWPFDEVEIRDSLRSGHNFIAVEAYNPGIGTFQYLHCSAAGFLCAAEWEDGTVIHTDKATWQMRRAPGNRPHVARLSYQMGFQEDFDAAKDDLSWISSPTEPEWRAHDMFRWSGETAFGRLPWATLEERSIPLLREEMIVPEKIIVHGTGNMEPGWRDCFNLAWQWMEKEVHSVKTWHSGHELHAEPGRDGLCFRLEPVRQEEFRAVVISLGTIRTGTFEIEVAGSTGGEIVDCLYYQYLDNGVPVDLLPIGNGGLLALATRLRTAPGTSRRMFYQLQGAKYIVLVFRGLSHPLQIKTAWRTAEYPFAMRGMFETSDRLLNEIHRLCRHTQQICAIDAYVDTPWREQGQWWGDARVQGKNTFYLDSDSQLLRRGIYSIAGQETENGLTYGVAPCCSGGCILPDFSLTWILTIFDYYWQTGDLTIFHDQHDRIKQIFAYFRSPAACGNNGLLQYDPRYWLFEDWASLPKEGFPTFLNLWHFYTLQHYEKLLRADDMEAEADAVTREIAVRRQLVVDRFFDAEQKWFISGFTLSGNCNNESPSLHDQVLAILCGLKPELHRQMAEQRLLPFLRGEKTDYAVPTSFWCTYLFDAAKQLGYRREVLDFIRSGWGKMIPSGGTWEHFIWNRDDGQSCCHAWSAHPASHLVDILGGIKQTAPAWQQFECHPDPALLPESGRILLPLPNGDFVLTWSPQLFALEVPNSTTVDFECNRETQILTAGEYSFPRE